jgi:hypothetical protein
LYSLSFGNLRSAHLDYSAIVGEAFEGERRLLFDFMLGKPSIANRGRGC